MINTTTTSEIPKSNASAIDKLRPLPDEILQMSDSETACNYCGISYLLLSKYEKLSTIVASTNSELESLKSYIQERPGVFNQLESLKSTNQSNILKIQELNIELQDALKKLHWDELDISDLKKNIESLNIKIDKQNHKHNGILDSNFNSLKKLKIEFCSLFQSFKNITIETRNFITEFDSNYSKEELKKKFTEFFQNIHVNISTATELKYTQQLKLENEKNKNLNDKTNQLLEEYVTLEKENKQLKDEKYEFQNSFKLLLQQQKDNNNNLKSENENLKFEIQELKTSIQSKSNELNEKQTNNDNEIISLNDILKKSQTELNLLKQQIQKEHEHTEASKALASQAGIGLAKKDEMINQLQKSIYNLNEQIVSLKKDRENTIDAHQSRIKQLQETFLEQLNNVRNSEIEKGEIQAKRIMNAEKEAAIKEWTNQLRGEYEVKERTWNSKLLLEHEKIAQLQTKFQSTEDSYKENIEILNLQIKKLQSSNAADFEHYQTRVRALEEEIVKLKQNADKSSQSKESNQLQSALAKSYAEIECLKNTVRLECEERIQLVSELSMIKGGNNATPKIQNNESKFIQKDNSTIQDSVERDFEYRMQKAASSRIQKEYCKIKGNAFDFKGIKEIHDLK